MEINNIVSNALSGVFPRQELIFTNSSTTWNTNSRTPTITTENITLQGRIQPVSPAQMLQLGFDIQEHEYYQVFISNTEATQIDRIRQKGCSTFIYNQELYKVIGKQPYDTNNWRHLYCYKILEGEGNG